MSEIKINIFIGNYESRSTIDANIHPEIQIDNLLAFLKRNSDRNDYITIYTNSIYVLNKIMILQLYSKKNIDCDYFKHKITECAVYEVKVDNSISKVADYRGTVSDDNLLNNMIESSNEEVAKILELCQKEK